MNLHLGDEQEMNRILEAFCLSQDKFAFIVESKDFYHPGTTCSALKMLHDFSKQASGERSGAIAELGLFYHERLRTRSHIACQHIIRIRDEHADDVEIATICDTVTIAYECLRNHDYKAAYSLAVKLERELSGTSFNFLYVQSCLYLGLACIFLEHYKKAETVLSVALGICLRFQYAVSYGYALNNMALLMKRTCAFDEADRMYSLALDVFEASHVHWGKLVVLGNRAILHMRRGNWDRAQRHFEKAISLKNELMHWYRPVPSDSELELACEPDFEHLLLLQRHFDVRARLEVLRTKYSDITTRRRRCLVLRMLGELYTEIGEYSDAQDCFSEARHCIGGANDVLPGLLRRQAHLQLLQGRFEISRSLALACIRLCQKNGEQYERGAAVRVLGDVYTEMGRWSLAGACYRASGRILQNIHDKYEYMRVRYSEGQLRILQGDEEGADRSLLEALGIARDLRLLYYEALISAKMVRVSMLKKRWEEAKAYLGMATRRAEHLQERDRKRVQKEVEQVTSEYQIAVARAGVRSAEGFRAVCEVYEDARFPTVAAKPELLYRIASRVGAEFLFVAAKQGSGARVLLTFNIGSADARRVGRQFLKDESGGLWAREDYCVAVRNTPEGSVLVAVPWCRRRGDGGVMERRFVCVSLSMTGLTVNGLEVLCASIPAIERLIEEDGVGQAFEEQSVVSLAQGWRKGPFGRILTCDPHMITMIRLADRAAKSMAPILIRGETGVGKELFARCIHAASARADRPFVAVNAGGLPLTLLESELFGHIRGSFTGAVSDRVGLVEQSMGGTLFLDEVGEMSEELQVKLLRLLENGEYRKLGESTTRNADIRLISATNRDLKASVDGRAFRADLFYRISAVQFDIPALRKRRSDIELLIRHFLHDCRIKSGCGHRVIQISPEAIEALRMYDWPGNIRELHNEVLRIVSLLGSSDTIGVSMLSDNVRAFLAGRKRGRHSLEQSVQHFERCLILEALERNGWNRVRAADSMGIPRTTLLAKLKRLGIASHSGR